MIHFVKQLQYFSHLDVIECSWVALMHFVEKGEGDLDALIDAHTSYINRLATKALLRVPMRRAHAQEEESIMNGVKEAFKLALKFKDTLDALCNYALAEASRLQDTRSRFSVCTTIPFPLCRSPDAQQHGCFAVKSHIFRYAGATRVSVTSHLGSESSCCDARAASSLHKPVPGGCARPGGHACLTSRPRSTLPELPHQLFPVLPSWKGQEISFTSSDR